MATKERPDFARFRVKKLCQDLHVVTLLVLSVVTAVQAQSTWVAGATTNNVWNKNLNSFPNTVPNSFTVTTIFGPAKVTNLFVDLKVDVGEIQFPALAGTQTWVLKKNKRPLQQGAHSGSGDSQAVSVNVQRIEYRNPRELKPTPESDNIYSKLKVSSP